MEFTASLQVSGEKLEPSLVSEVLGLVPSCQVRRGAPRMARGRIAGHATRGVWSLESSAGEEAQLGEHLGQLLLILRNRASGLAKLRSMGFAIEIFVGIFDVSAGSEVLLDPKRLLELGSLGVDLRLDLYPEPD